MAYKAYISDLRRVVEVKPNIDVTDRLILAKVYEDGELLGIANVVTPDMDNLIGIILELFVDNATGSDQTVTITLYGKEELGAVEEQVDQEILTVPDGVSQHDVSLSPGNHVDLRLSVIVDNNANVSITFNNITSKLVGTDNAVVGGPAGETIEIPCDFTQFDSSDNYSLVIEAFGVGLISKDRLILFDDDGYKVK